MGMDLGGREVKPKFLAEMKTNALGQFPLMSPLQVFSVTVCGISKLTNVLLAHYFAVCLNTNNAVFAGNDVGL